MISADLETARPAQSEGFADAVTVSFADLDRGWFGMARIGLCGDSASALAILFRGREPVDVVAEGSLPAPAQADWMQLSVGQLRTTVQEPLERWTIAWDGGDSGFDLDLEAASAPAERRAGLAGYEQLVRVRGTVRGGGESHEIEGLGQRGHAWGVADWSSLELVRTISAWLGEDDGGIVLESLRDQGSDGHDREQVWAALVERGEPVAVADPRLSTTYDGDGHQRRAGLELWLTEEEEEEAHPVRAAGEVICGSSLDLGALRLDLAFFRWHSGGIEGVGRYDVLRRSS